MWKEILNSTGLIKLQIIYIYKYIYFFKTLNYVIIIKCIVLVYYFCISW